MSPRPKEMTTQLRIISLFLFASALIWTCVSVPAQGQAIHIDSKLVIVPVTVSDRNGRHITSLEKADFRVLEDGAEQAIDVFEPVESVIYVYLLLDVSGSVTKFAEEIANASSIFVKQLRPNDMVSVASFAYDRRVLVDKKRIREFKGPVRIQVFPLDPGTLVYETVGSAARSLSKARGRKAIILFSDGVDTGVHTKLERALIEIEEQDASIYSIHYGSNEPPSKFVDPKRYGSWQQDALVYMRSIAEKTGGRYFRIEEISNLSETFRQIADELGRQYTLGYYSKKDGKKGERRQIKVIVNRPDVAVRSRTSYVLDK